MIKQIIFIILITQILIHEMDAIRAKEYKMFVGLKRLPEEIAHIIFTILHVPLFFIIFFVMLESGEVANTILYYVIDLFAMFHAVIHFIFRKHVDNSFKSIYSKILIYSLPILAISHIFLLQI